MLWLVSIINQFHSNVPFLNPLKTSKKTPEVSRYFQGTESEHWHEMSYRTNSAQLKLTCSISTIETLEKGVKYVQS